MDLDREVRGFDNLCRLFPLPGVVLFPHAVLPLHIFESRYRQMTRDALSGDRLVTIVQALPRGAPDPHRPPVEEVGCLGKILLHEALPDGRFNFLLLGCKRVRLVRELPDPGTLYRQATAEILEDEEPADETEAHRRSELVARFSALSDGARPPDPDLAALLASDLPLGTLTDIIAHALGLPPGLKQGLLDECRVDHRADTLSAILQQLLTGPGSAAEPGKPTFPPPFSRN